MFKGAQEAVTKEKNVTEFDVFLTQIIDQEQLVDHAERLTGAASDATQKADIVSADELVELIMPLLEELAAASGQMDKAAQLSAKLGQFFDQLELTPEQQQSIKQNLLSLDQVSQSSSPEAPLEIDAQAQEMLAAKSAEQGVASSALVNQVDQRLTPVSTSDETSKQSNISAEIGSRQSQGESAIKALASTGSDKAANTQSSVKRTSDDIATATSLNSDKNAQQSFEEMPTKQVVSAKTESLPRETLEPAIKLTGQQTPIADTSTQQSELEDVAPVPPVLSDQQPNSTTKSRSSFELAMQDKGAVSKADLQSTAANKSNAEKTLTLQEIVTAIEQADPAVPVDLAQLKRDLKFSIEQLSPEQRQQLKQQVAQGDKILNQVMPAAQLLDQIEGAQQVTVVAHSASKEAALAPELTRYTQKTESKESSSQTADVDNDEQILNADDVALQEKKTTAIQTLDSLLKQFEAPSKPVPANQLASSPSETNSALNARLDSQESPLVSSGASTASAKTIEQQLAQKMPLHEQFAANALKERVKVMVNGGLSQAVIQLDPEELGAMSIRISMQQDQLNVQFQVQNPAAKEMLEQAMVKLKDMLEQQGIALNQSDVEQQSQGEQQQTGDEQQQSDQQQFASEELPVTLVLNKHSANGIDYYA